jgi:putative tricarboxylic transport membrane protein
MTGALLDALQNLLTLQHMGFLALGVCVGLMVGVMPGLGGIAGLSLLLPFLYGMDATSALAMLIGLVAVIPTSDTFTSVLMGIPGSSASQATVLDGFPLARQGQAARALAAAFMASLVGGLFGAAILTGFVIVARPLILSFGSAELFMLTLFGLSMVGVLAGASLWKGIAAACLGLVLGSVGAAPATGEYRMEFGTLYLMDGVPLVVMALGLFAVPEIVDLLRSRAAISDRPTLGRGWITGLRDTWRHRWLALRCSGLGAMIGAIPGLGGSVVDWIAYGHVVQTSKDRSQFGRGDIRGVIAPESANNAKEGGALVPTLLFGIPGSGSMAIFLAGLILLGIQPGPAMAERNLGITYTIVWSLALANVLGAGLCILMAPGIARLTTIRYALIAPFMMMVICFAAFQATRSSVDLVALVAVGALGVLLKRFGWPRPAFLIGFVLATQSERYLYQAVQFTGWGFVGRPLVLAILALTVLSIWAGLRKRPGGGDGPGGDGARGVESEGSAALARADGLWPQLAFGLFVLGLFAYAFAETVALSFLGAVFPVSVAVVGLVASGFVLLPLLRGRRDSSSNFDMQASAGAQALRHPWLVFLWLAGFVGLTGLIGFFAALLLFFVAFLRVEARAGWGLVLLLTGAAAGFILALANGLNLVFPGGLLQEMADLPWPFR